MYIEDRILPVTIWYCLSTSGKVALFLLKRLILYFILMSCLNQSKPFLFSSHFHYSWISSLDNKNLILFHDYCCSILNFSSI